MDRNRATATVAAQNKLATSHDLLRFPLMGWKAYASAFWQGPDVLLRQYQRPMQLEQAICFAGVAATH